MTELEDIEMEVTELDNVSNSTLVSELEVTTEQVGSGAVALSRNRMAICAALLGILVVLR